MRVDAPLLMDIVITPGFLSISRFRLRRLGPLDTRKQVPPLYRPSMDIGARCLLKNMGTHSWCCG